MKTEIIYLMYYENDIAVITNNPKKWLKENNERRLKEGHEKETLNEFTIIEKDYVKV